MQKSLESATPVMRYLLLMASRKVLVIWIVLLSAGFTAAYSLLMPKTYQSRAVIAPPAGGGNLLAGLMGNLPMGDLLGGIGGGMTDGEGQYFVTLLGSRQVHEELARQFDLRKHYKMVDSEIEDLLKMIAKRVKAELDFDSGMINLTVQDKDPERAFAMASWLIQRLESLNHELKTRRARNNREFAEQEVRQMRQDLDSLERAMLVFQKDKRVLEPEEQGRAILAQYAGVKSQEAIKDLELRLARQVYGARHPSVIKIEEELSAIRQQLKSSWESGDSDMYLAIHDLPAATMEYLGYKRELEIANSKLLFMLPQLEQAKLDEVNNIPVLEVLDPPVKAEKRIKPKRTIMVLTAGLLALLAASVLVLFLDRVERDEIFAAHLQDFVRRLRGGRPAA